MKPEHGTTESDAHSYRLLQAQRLIAAATTLAKEGHFPLPTTPQELEDTLPIMEAIAKQRGMSFEQLIEMACGICEPGKN
jgi:hypothetical protein